MGGPEKQLRPKAPQEPAPAVQAPVPDLTRSNNLLCNQVSTIQCHQPPSNDFDFGNFDLSSMFLQQPQGPQEPLPELRRPEIMDRMATTVDMTDGVARNLEITSQYHEVSNMLDQAIFSDPAEQGQTANWNTFGTWASNEAGRAIRGEGNWVMDAGNWLARNDPTGLVQGQVDGTQAALAEGNKVVFSEIAPASAMFAENFGGDTERDPKKWEAFVQWMDEEAPNKDPLLGNSRLTEAFSSYYDAMLETDPDRRQELMFQGNALIGQHEQTRLQPHIEEAMPWGVRQDLTRYSMGLNLPTNESGPAGLDFSENYRELDLSEEVRPTNWYGGYTEGYPEALQSLDDPSVQNVWEEVDPHWWNSGGTVGAENWTNYDDRMAYISELFRANQNDPRLHNVPFTEEQKQDKLNE